MRIGIVGAGGVGSVVGGLLSHGGHDVTLVDQWPEHIDKIKRDGLLIESRNQSILTHPNAIHICELAQIIDPFEAAFIAVKSYDTTWATALMLDYVDPKSGVFVDFQNGINDERMAAVAGTHRSLGCVIIIGVGCYEPGKAIRTDAYPLGFKVGEHDGSDTPRARRIVQTLSCIAPTEVTSDLWGNRWSKLMVNCMANALAGLSGYGTAEVRTIPQIRRVAIQLGAEVARVALALGHELHPISGVSPLKIIDAAEGRNLEEVEAVMLKAASGGGKGIPSMGQDVRKKRRTEIEYLNGHVSEKGRTLGIPTPFNDRIVQIVKELGIGFESDPSHLKPLEEMLP